MNISEMAQALGGRVDGDRSVSISGVAALDEAGPGDVSFLSNPKYAAAVAGTKASAVIVNDSWTGTCPCALIRVQNADRAFAIAAVLLAPPPVKVPAGIHPTAIIAGSATLGTGVAVGPYCIVEPGAKIGDRTQLAAGCYVGHDSVIGKDGQLHPHVSIRERSLIGDRVILHNGVVIGSDGFGYAQNGERWEKIPQVGIVEIGDDVEIGANTTVDRARFGKTIIANDVKIDNLVQVAHNCRIGENTAIAGQAGIAGSSRIGRNCRIGGQAGISGHIEIGNNCVVGAQAGVIKDVPDGTFVSGYPAAPHEKAKEIHAHLMRLPHLKKRVAELELRLTELEAKLNAAK